METLTNDPAPSVQSGFEAEPAVIAARFGRGYEQASGDGPPGSLLLTWPLIWRNITKAKAGVLHEFFKSHGGWKKFEWTPIAPHDGASKTFVCRVWRGTYLGGDCVDFTATLEERPPL